MNLEELLAELEHLPEEWQLCCADGCKKPFHPDQQFLANGSPDPSTPSWKAPLPCDRIQSEIERGRAKAIGILLGRDYIAVDADGPNALRFAEKLSGQPVAGCLNHTRTWTSGIDGHQESLYSAPKPYQGLLNSHKQKVGKELFEWRYTGTQSIIVGTHPTTGRYRDINSTTQLAPLSWWLIRENLRAKVEWENLSGPERALVALSFLDPTRADDYDNWLGPGAVLQYVASQSSDPEAEANLLTAWDLWSQQCPEKYEPGLCEKKWNSFHADRASALTLGSLLKWASDDDESRQKVIQIENHTIKLTGVPWKGRKVETCQTSNSTSLLDDIDTLIKQDLNGSQLEISIQELAKKVGKSNRDVWRLYKIRHAELDAEPEKAEAVSKLPSLVECRNLRLDPRRFLDGDMGELIIQTAKAMPSSPAFIFTTLLSACASLIGTSSRIVVKPSAKYFQPCIIQAAIVAETGQKKTPAQGIVIDPIMNMEVEAFAQYQADQQIYEKELIEYEIQLGVYKKERKECPDIEPPDKPKPPVRKRYVTSNSTLEAVLEIHAENLRGFLGYWDELIGGVKSRNQYRGGIGADAEQELILFNGKHYVIDRKSGKLLLPRTAISRTGSIQWSILQQWMGNYTDDQGELARWLFCAETPPPAYIDLTERDEDNPISDRLKELYQKLLEAPEQDYLLSLEGKVIFQQFQHQLTNWCRAESQPGLKAAYPKFESYMSRLALILHIVNSVLRAEVKPDAVISGETLQQSVELVKYFITQLRLIYAQNSSQPELSNDLLKIWIFAEGKGVPVSARDVQTNIRTFKSTPSTLIRNKFIDLVQSGYGIVVGTGNHTLFNPTSENSPLESVSNVSTLAKPHIHQDFDTADRVSANVSNVSSSKAKATQQHEACELIGDELDKSADIADKCRQGVSSVESNEAIGFKQNADIADAFIEKKNNSFNEPVTKHGQISSHQSVEANFDDSTKNLSQKKSHTESAISDPWLADEVVTEPPPKPTPTDYWRTPNTDEQPILTRIAEVLDGIGLDPTADDAKTVPARHHFTQSDNCLDKSWQALGAVFMNPLFSKPLPFVEKLVEEYQAGHTPEAIALLKAGTLQNKGTGSIIWSSANAICHWGCGKARRIAFLDEKGNPVHGADFDCILVYWGSKREQFKEVFQHYGNVSFNEPKLSSEQIVVKNGDIRYKHADKPSSPRDAVTLQNGKVKVDLESTGAYCFRGALSIEKSNDPEKPDRFKVNPDKLDLDWQPEKPIEPWEPTKKLKPYPELSKLFIDIETTSLDPTQGRIIMVGLMNEHNETTLITDSDEKVLLRRTIEHLEKHKPEVLIGHNSFAFDLRFIMDRCRGHRVKHPFTIARKPSRITSSSVHGKPIEFTPVYWRGVEIVDSYHLCGIFDKSNATLSSYSLKDSVLDLGLRKEKRVELSADEINEYWEKGYLARIQEYLRFDLEDTRLLCDHLLPVVYFQQQVVPELSLQQLAVSSSALKAEKVIESFYPGIRPESDSKKGYDGGYAFCRPGLYRNAAKLDIVSLYPSIMLRYRLCSRKDTNQEFLRVLQYLKEERLRLKKLAKQGDKQADHQQGALKILLNGSYGYFGTAAYLFNDCECAALIPAIGQKIVKQMIATVEAHDGVIAEVDTDGIIVSRDDPEMLTKVVRAALPDGIEVALEWSNRTVYLPKMKSYLVFDEDGKVKRLGEYRKRNRSKLQTDYPVEFLRHYIDSPQAAEEYHKQLLQQIDSGQLPIEFIQIREKIRKGDRKLTGAGLGQVGDKVVYYLTTEEKFHKRTGKAINSIAVPTTDKPYAAWHYCREVEQMHKDLLKVLGLGRAS